MDPGAVVAIVGPTATGKSDLALALAEALGGEVVNADAMQLYRGMDVGTAKLSPAERRGVAHHQIDVLDVTQEASVARYQRSARADLAGIAQRGRRGILAGGSGLYVRAVLDDLVFPGTDPALRTALTERAERIGPHAMHAELAALDPTAAEAIGPANVRRVVRAIEVIRLTGAPFTAHLPEDATLLPAVQVGLRLDRAALDERIAARARTMFRTGLVAEVEGLLAAHGHLGRTASRAVGYAQVLAVLADAMSAEDALDSTIVATQRLARRQERWFGRDRRVTWLDAAVGPDALAAAALRTLTG